MVILSFEKGKNAMVNVCPYSNHELEDTESQLHKVTTTKQ